MTSTSAVVAAAAAAASPTADDSEAEALYKFGNCYAEEIGNNVDMRKAVEWWTRAAEAGHAEVEDALSICQIETANRRLDEQIVCLFPPPSRQPLGQAII